MVSSLISSTVELTFSFIDLIWVLTQLTFPLKLNNMCLFWWTGIYKLWSGRRSFFYCFNDWITGSHYLLNMIITEEAYEKVQSLTKLHHKDIWRPLSTPGRTNHKDLGSKGQTLYTFTYSKNWNNSHWLILCIMYRGFFVVELISAFWKPPDECKVWSEKTVYAGEVSLEEVAILNVLHNTPAAAQNR